MSTDIFSSATNLYIIFYIVTDIYTVVFYWFVPVLKARSHLKGNIVKPLLPYLATISFQYIVLRSVKTWYNCERFHEVLGGLGKKKFWLGNPP